MYGPEIGLIRAQDAQRLLDGIAFPGGAHLGVPEQGMCIRNIEQAVQQAAVAQINLWGARLSLAGVLEPGLKLAHHEGAA